MDETLKFINKEQLFQFKMAWDDHEKKRDNEIMANIYNYR